MRYAIFTDIHANLEALEAVLAKIDELAQEEPIDQIWFLGDLVGYGPNPNECIDKIRERTDVIIAGNHDWAAVGKIDLEDFSEAARISALWTAEQLTEEHRTFLTNLPERLEMDECLLVHGSPYGPLWEYLTSEVLAERSFQYFSNRYCFVGHTHVPIIFQQSDTIANAPTRPLDLEDISTLATQGIDEEVQETPGEAESAQNVGMNKSLDGQQDAESVGAFQATALQTTSTTLSENAHIEKETLQEIVADAVDAVAELQQHMADDIPSIEAEADEISQAELAAQIEANGQAIEKKPATESVEIEKKQVLAEENTETAQVQILTPTTETVTPVNSSPDEEEETQVVEETTSQATILSAEERLNDEIEELLALLGLSQSMVQVTNEMIIPPEGSWQAPEGYRAIVNPGGVGQPRDGDARAAFMIYNTEKGFTFYRIPYSYEKTQEKIIKAQLPNYLATRLAYGR